MMQAFAPGQSQLSMKKQKSKQDYSRNVKKLKYKLLKIQDQIQYLQQRIQSFQNLSNDHVISMKISKFCKQRRFTPQMLFRFADNKNKNTVSRADFRKTFNQIGLKLTQHQLTRLQYLLDENISGQISWQQYNKYLYAFNMKKQYNPQDPFIKNALQKLDLNKIFQLSKQKQNDSKSKHKNLLNYQEFIKYCHKHFPQITGKQLAGIFNKLKRNQLIDIEDLLNYLKNIQEQKRRIEQKNKKKQDANKKKKQKQKNNQQWKIQEQQQTIDVNTLKGIYMAILKFHPKEQRTFHSSEFKRVQISFNCKKGELVALFRAIDKKLQGSVGYNELIRYYVEIQIYKNDERATKFAFQLMGKKMVSQGQKPQSLIQTYCNKQKQFITPQQFQKLCTLQFQLKPSQANYLYNIMLKHKPLKQNSKYVQISTFLQMMKLGSTDRPVVKPNLWGVFSNHFYSKNSITITTDGMIAFRLCNSIAQQIHAMRIKKWDDFEFGPTFQDQNGFDCIKMNMVSNSIRWVRTQQLGMKDFYISSIKQEKIYQTSPLCQSDLFHKSLQLLINQDPYFLYTSEKQVIKNGKNIEQSQLNKLFAGLHPLVFHDFQQWGIYVIKLYIKGKWVYVIVDDKIPCDMKGQPLFSYTMKRNCSYVSLIQKAYAKLKGSYEKVFESPSFSKYINQLSSLLSYDIQIQSMQNERENTNQWSQITSQTNLQHQKLQFKISQQKKQSYYKAFTGNLVLPYRKLKADQKSGLQKNLLIKSFFSTQFVDQSNKQNNKLHKLMICQTSFSQDMEDQNKWNPQWYPKSQKYNKYSNLISKVVNEWNKQNQIPKINLNSTKILILNFQLMQQIFNSLFITKTISFQGQMNIMRKTLQFQNNISCLYKVNSTDPNKHAKLIILLNKIKGPQDSTISIKMKQSSTNKPKPKDPYNFYDSYKKDYLIKSDYSCTCHFISQQQQDIEIKVQNFKSNQQYIYQLTFYFDNPRFSLKQRDRHLLFRYVSAYQQHPKIDFGILEIKQKQYFYSRYFANAGRKGILCC